MEVNPQSKRLRVNLSLVISRNNKDNLEKIALLRPIKPELKALSFR